MVPSIVTNDPTTHASFSQHCDKRTYASYLAPLERDENEVPATQDFTPRTTKDAAPTKPKRPRTAYNIYFRDQQDKMKKSKTCANLKSANIAKTIAASWKNVTPSVRVHYDQLAVEDKYRYYAEKVEYQNPVACTRKSARKEEMQKQQRQEQLINTPPAVPSTVEYTKDTKVYISTLQSEQFDEDQHQQVYFESNMTLSGDVELCSNEQAQRSRHSSRPTSPAYSHQAIADLASKLDDESIDFLIRALK